MNHAIRQALGIHLQTFPPGTALPQSLAVISASNARELREIARLGKGQISKATYSPDGKFLAVGTSIGIYLYDAETLQEIRFLNSQEWISTIAFSPDSTLLAANGPSNSILLWQVSDGQLLATGMPRHASMPARLTLQGHTDWVRSVNFSPDGQLLASGSYDNTVRLWREGGEQLLTTGMPRHASMAPRLTLQGHTSWVSSVSFSPDGRLLASGSYDGTIRLWGVVGE